MYAHKTPRFIIKNWIKEHGCKVFSKSLNKDRPINYKKDFAEEDYYGDELEKKLSLVESQIAPIFKKIDNWTNPKHIISDKEWFYIVLYMNIQTIRKEGISEFIDEPDEMYPGNNHFLFGAHSSNDKDEILANTEYLVDIFNEYEESKKGELSGFVRAVGIVVWKSDGEFVLGETSVFKETDMDGRFLFISMPISPDTTIVISKNSYFSSLKNLEFTKDKIGDPYLSVSVEDQYLINNFKHDSFMHYPFYAGRDRYVPVYRYTPDAINKVMYQDSSDIVIYKGEIKIDELIKEISGRKTTINW